MKLNKNPIENFTRDDVKYYENKVSTINKRNIKKKVKQEDFTIPEMCDYEHIIVYNFNVAQLRMIAKKYKLKISGNKNELNKRIYLFLLYNFNAIKIQKNTRRKFVYKYVSVHGPAFNNKSKCVNEQDFFSLEKISSINYVNFFSEEDNGMIYGFDIVSLYNFIRKEKSQGKSFKNPFTNCEFENTRVYHRVKRFIKLSKILKTELNVNSIEEENNNCASDDFGHNVRQLFLYIDSLGNYTNYTWFMNLSRIHLVKFIRELHDIWNYRADLTNQAKQNICSPSGNPFLCRTSRVPLVIVNDLVPTEIVRYRTFKVMENMVRYSINPENSAIGCYYLLGALTLVSEEAAESLPWLYQCMYHS